MNQGTDFHSMKKNKLSKYQKKIFMSIKFFCDKMKFYKYPRQKETKFKKINTFFSRNNQFSIPAKLHII